MTGPGPAVGASGRTSAADGPRLPIDAPLRHVVDAPPVELLASWPRRIAAVVLDHALIAAATFLLLPVQPVAPLTLPGLPPTVTGTDPVQLPGNEGLQGWIIGLVALMMLGQAYLGSTPGKLVMGIAVVRRHDGRPAGLWRTAVRALVHVLDGLILMIGFARPLWHPLRQTWADSAMGTVALRTRSPRPFLYRHDPGPPPPPWQREGPSPARDTARWILAALCVPALLLTYGWTSGTGAVYAHEQCLDPGTPARDGTFTVVDAVVETARATPGTVSKMWIERVQATPSGHELRVTWQWEGDLPDEPVQLRIAFTSADGSVTRTVPALLHPAGHLEPDWTSSLGPASVEGEQLIIPMSVVDDLGPGWTWQVSATTAQGLNAGRCSGPDLMHLGN